MRFEHSIVRLRHTLKVNRSTYYKHFTSPPAQPLLFHTDRGTQYTSSEMRQFLDHHSLTYSYSKKGYPWDNAVT
ncbi:DDE-type integrase/transposase/recombinase, partial [Listeria seeligeri]|nr:transposase family protein [Listeria seeligeri]MBF2371526.1 DDE-type integrase/transposase/recombinase [Listeria seeligeri]